MARSILPSRWRGAGEAKALVRRAYRHRASNAMRSLVQDPLGWDDGEGDDEDGTHAIRVLVRGRRFADRLNHFERWATQVTRALPREDRVGHIKAILPAGLIGEHAVTHVVRWEAFESLEDKQRRRHWRPRARLFLDRGELAALLREIVITPGAHRALNRALEAVVSFIDLQGDPHRIRGSRPPRKLLGGYDVLPFLDALELYPNRALKNAMNAFCVAFKASSR